MNMENDPNRVSGELSSDDETRRTFPGDPDNSVPMDNPLKQLLGNISHELCTPLNGILGIQDLLIETDLTSEQRDYVDIAQNNARSLLTMINHVLDYTKIESGKFKIDSIPFDLPSLIQQAVAKFNSKAQEKGITLYLRLDSNLPQGYIGDPLRIHQVLNNLISNAIKFTENGCVEIKLTGEIVNKDWARLCFSVKDTGIGISKDTLEVIFEKFTQADTSYTRRYQGMGLGLALTKKLVELMNGEIHVESRLHKGSTFSFYLTLPIDQACQVAPETLPVTDMSLKELSGIHILLVEDNPANQKITMALLKKMDCDVTLARHGGEALELLEKSDFDIVFMDCQMPEMDGYEATRQIRLREGHDKHTPIVALTGHTTMDAQEKCHRVGMDDYIAKPAGRKEILDRINKYCGTENCTQLPDSLKILIVDDETNVIDSMVRGFKKHLPLATCRGTTCGVEACALLGSFMPDILFLDIKMPHMDGLEVIRFIRRNSRYSRIATLIITGLKADDKRIQAVRKLGVNDIILKPFETEDMIPRILKAVQDARKNIISPNPV